MLLYWAAQQKEFQSQFLQDIKNRDLSDYELEQILIQFLSTHAKQSNARLDKGLSKNR